MRQVIDWKAIKESNNKEYHWKYDGSYDKGPKSKLLRLDRAYVSEVMGFMTDYKLTPEEKLKVLEKQISLHEYMHAALASVDYEKLTMLINLHVTKPFEDTPFYKCSDYFEIKDTYTVKDVQVIVMEFAEEAMRRFVDEYTNKISWGELWRTPEYENEVTGMMCMSGITCEITESMCEIQFTPIYEGCDHNGCY